MLESVVWLEAFADAPQYRVLRRDDDRDVDIVAQYRHRDGWSDIVNDRAQIEAFKAALIDMTNPPVL